MNVAQKKIPKRWTEEEDRILHDETQKQSATRIKDWHRIAANLPGRTNKDCRKRWVNKVCGSLKKGAWNDDEDERLLSAVERHGQKWTLVADEVGFRSPDQCAKRWQSKLDPNLEHGGWTIEEDELLLTLVEENGREWKMFQEQYFSRRSTNELKNRFTGLSRKAKHSYSRARSISSCFDSGSSNLGTSDDRDEAQTSNRDHEIDKCNQDAGNSVVTGFLDHHEITQDWVNMLDDPTMWIDSFSPGSTSRHADILPGVYMAEHPSLMDLGKGAKIPTNNARSLSITGWAGLGYDAVMGVPDTEDHIATNPSLSLRNNGELINGLPGYVDGSNTDMECLVTDAEKGGPVGRVSVVIDECSLNTLHQLLEVTRDLRAKTKIEIGSKN